METFEGGSKRAEIKLPYDQIPLAGLKRIAARFQLGETNYGRDNWKESIHDPKFIRDCRNHAIEHMFLYAGGDTSDDHLGAIGWWICTQAWGEANSGAGIALPLQQNPARHSALSGEQLRLPYEDSPNVPRHHGLRGLSE